MSKESKHRPQQSEHPGGYGPQAQPNGARATTLKSFLETISTVAKNRLKTSETSEKPTGRASSRRVARDITHDSLIPPPFQSGADNTLFAREVFEASFHCNYKLYMKLRGQRDVKSDYEMLCDDSREKVANAATARIHACHPEGNVPVGIRLTTSLLKRGNPFILDTTLTTEFGALHLDGLRKVCGFSRLGDFHYIPIIFHEGQKVRKEQKLFLELCGLFLYRMQGTIPTQGAIYGGRECKLSMVRLPPNLNRARHVLDEIRQLRNSEQAPRLILNNHCKICEFMQRCYREAIEEDNISLLGGIGEKEIKTYAKKGIFTIL